MSTWPKRSQILAAQLLIKREREGKNVLPISDLTRCVAMCGESTGHNGGPTPTT